MFAFVFYILFKSLTKPNLRPKWFFSLEIIFILFAVLQIMLKLSINSSETISMIQTLLISLLLYYSVYLYAISKKNFDEFLKTFYYSVFFSIFFNVAIEIITTLIYSSSTPLVINGIQIGGAISISIGLLSGVLIVLSTLIYRNNDLKFWLVFVLLFGVILFVSDRKSLLFVPLCLYVRFFITKKSSVYFKVLIASLVSFMILIILYLNTVYPGYYENVLPEYISNMVKYFSGNISEIDEGSIRTRVSLINLARTVFYERPWLGWGLNTFSTSINSGGYYSHNNFFEILVGVGVIGLIIYYLKYLTVLFALIKERYKTNSEHMRVMITVFFAILLSFVIIEYWQVTYFSRKFILIWVIGLVLVTQSKKVEG